MADLIEVVCGKFFFSVPVTALRLYGKIFGQTNENTSVVACLIFSDKSARNEVGKSAEVLFIRHYEQYAVIIFFSERFLRNARIKPLFIGVALRFVVLVRRAVHRFYKLFGGKHDSVLVVALLAKFDFLFGTHRKLIAKFTAVAS